MSVLKPIPPRIVALRNEKGSYNLPKGVQIEKIIVALRNEKGSYNSFVCEAAEKLIVALRNEKGSYNQASSYDSK